MKTDAMFERVLLRHTTTNTPETRLLVAVLVQAFRDATDKRHPSTEAREYLLGNRCAPLASLIGLESAFVNKLVDAALTNEPLLEVGRRAA